MKHNLFSKVRIQECLRLLIVSISLGLLLAGFFHFSVGIELSRSYLLYLPLLFPFVLALQKYIISRYKVTVHSVKMSLIPNQTDFLTCLFVFTFTIFSYITGASVGREGTCVVMAEALKPKNKLSDLNWKFILASMGFAGALGSLWLGPLFYLEVFSLKLKQKLSAIELVFTFIGSAVVCAIMSYLKVSYFDFVILFEGEWIKKFNFYSFLVVMTLIFGFLAFVFKGLYQLGHSWYQRQPFRFQIFIAFLVGLLFIAPPFRIFQGLGLQLIDSPYVNLANSLFLGLGKMAATLLSLSMGFLGGEFVPALIIGAKLGQAASWFFPEFIVLGSALGFFLFFGCITRLFWVCILSAALHFGWQIGIVFSLVLWCALKISGTQSVYFKSESLNKIDN